MPPSFVVIWRDEADADVPANSALLLGLEVAGNAERRLLNSHVSIDGCSFPQQLVLLATSLQTHDGPRGGTVGYRAASRTALVAKRLMRAGFKRVRRLGDGIEVWIERGSAV